MSTWNTFMDNLASKKTQSRDIKSLSNNSKHNSCTDMKVSSMEIVQEQNNNSRFLMEYYWMLGSFSKVSIVESTSNLNYSLFVHVGRQFAQRRLG